MNDTPAIFAVSAAVTVATQSEIVWLFLGAGVLAWLVRVPPDWLTRGGVATAGVLWRFKKVPQPLIVLVAAAIGLVVHPLVAHGAAP